MFARCANSDSLVKRLSFFSAIALAIMFAAAWVLISLSTSSGNTLSDGLEVASLCVITVLIGIHGVLIFLQWNAKPCFCPTKSNQKKPEEPPAVSRRNASSLSGGDVRESQLPEGFNSVAGWTFATGDFSLDDEQLNQEEERRVISNHTDTSAQLVESERREEEEDEEEEEGAQSRRRVHFIRACEEGFSIVFTANDITEII